MQWGIKVENNSLEDISSTPTSHIIVVQSLYSKKKQHKICRLVNFQPLLLKSPQSSDRWRLRSMMMKGVGFNVIVPHMNPPGYASVLQFSLMQAVTARFQSIFS